MKKHTYLLILLALLSKSYSQSLIEISQFGEFSNAEAFTVSPSKYFFVTDSQTSELSKIDSTGKTLKTVGGYGWDDNSFDNPIDVYTNLLTAYVADKNNNRIRLFDRELNSISNFSTQNSNDEKTTFKYPTSVAVSSQGDLYILDSDNKRVLKFNMRGEFLNSIGGFDAGTYQLSNPQKLCLDLRGNLIALQQNSLNIFDQFGNGLFKINLPFSPTNINSFFDSVVLVNYKSVMIFKIAESGTYEIMMSPTDLNLEEEVVDALLFNSRLYVLTKKSIHVFRL